MENTYVHHKSEQQVLYGINRKYKLVCNCTTEHDLSTDIVTFTIDVLKPAAVYIIKTDKIIILKSN